MPDLDKTLDNFIAHTSKSKVAIVVPLYGYWKDIEDNPLNLQTLQLTLDRLNSSTHSLYLFFVAEPERIPADIKNLLVIMKQQGNCSFVEVPKGASYTEYVREGFRVAMETTDSAYFINLNPWNLIQRIGIDVMVDRLNYGDEEKIISGWNLRPEVTSENFDPKAFEEKRFNIPVELQRVDSNFMGIIRYALEMTPLDENIKTAFYLEMDMFQSLHSKGFTGVASQRLPMFVFDVNIESIENPSDLEADKKYFISKWGFIPAV